MRKKFETLTNEEKDGAQFDAGEAYVDIICVLEKEFGEQEWFNLLTWGRTPPKNDAPYRRNTFYLSLNDYKSGQTTIHELLDEAILQEGRFCGESSKYLVFCYGKKETNFDLKQPHVLLMKNYFPSTDNTNYKLIGLISHCGDNRSDGHNLALWFN